MSRFADGLPAGGFVPDAAHTGEDGRSLGLAIAALLPALFWTAMLYAGAELLGVNVGPLLLMGFMCLVAGFLAAVVSALQGRA